MTQNERSITCTWSAVAPASVAVDVFVPPSREQQWLLRRFAWLLAPEGARQRWYTRAFEFLIVAPFTQFTVCNFELQLFLFQIFHTRIYARLGHGLCMPIINFFMMVALAQLRLAPHPTAHGWSGPSLNGATLYALLLLAWYLAVALRERLYLWWLLTVPCTLALAFGADAYYCHFFTLDAAQRGFFTPTRLAANPFLWMWAAAQGLMLSHVPEPRLPPRVSDPWRWTSVRDFLLGGRGGRRSIKRVIRGALLLLVQIASGAINEWWASPRLMPYNLLVLMFRAGYRPDVAARAFRHAARAMASGNPAIDYIGIGGGAFLRVDSHR